MKCLSVKQPYAELIARGDKPLELRKRRLSYRGPLVIVSSAARAKERPDVDGPRSRAVALVEMIDCRPATPADAEGVCCDPSEINPGEFVWVLRLVRRLDIDVHVKGQLALFTPPTDLADAMRKAGIHVPAREVTITLTFGGADAARGADLARYALDAGTLQDEILDRAGDEGLNLTIESAVQS